VARPTLGSPWGRRRRWWRGHTGRGGGERQRRQAEEAVPDVDAR